MADFPQNALQVVIESDNVGDSSADATGGYYTDLSLPDLQSDEKERDTSTFKGRENLQLWTSKLSWKDVEPEPFEHIKARDYFENWTPAVFIAIAVGPWSSMKAYDSTGSGADTHEQVGDNVYVDEAGHDCSYIVAREVLGNNKISPELYVFLNAPEGEIRKLPGKPALKLSWKKIEDVPNDPVHYTGYVDTEGTFLCGPVDKFMPASKLQKLPQTTDWRKVTCPNCKLCRVEDALNTAHERETDRKHAEFYNQGWGSSDTSIASKTSKGILQSDIDPRTLRVTHTWEREASVHTGGLKLSWKDVEETLEGKDATLALSKDELVDEFSKMRGGEGVEDAFDLAEKFLNAKVRIEKHLGDTDYVVEFYDGELQSLSDSLDFCVFKPEELNVIVRKRASKKVYADPLTHTDASDIDQSYEERNELFHHTPATPQTTPMVDSLFTEPDPKAFPNAVQQPDYLRSERVWLTTPVDSIWKMRSSAKKEAIASGTYSEVRQALARYLVQHPDTTFVASTEESAFVGLQRKLGDLDSGFSDTYFNSMDINPEDMVKESPTNQHDQWDPVKYKNDTSVMRTYFEQGEHQTINRPETSRPITPYALLSFA